MDTGAKEVSERAFQNIVIKHEKLYVLGVSFDNKVMAGHETFLQTGHYFLWHDFFEMFPEMTIQDLLGGIKPGMFYNKRLEPVFESFLVSWAKIINKVIK